MSMSIKERFNLLLKKNEEETTSFDEGDFNLKIFGGPSQADLIRVDADLINPQKFGNRTIQLNCKWFNKTEKDLVEIVGTSGQNHYQPSLKDVGTIVRVQCFPEIQGKSYEGMPIIKDIGPLIIQKQTEQDAHEFVESGSATLFVRVTRTNKSTHYSEIDGIVKVTGEEIIIKTKQGDDFGVLMSGKFNQRFPSYQSDSKNHKLLKIFLNQQDYAEVLVQQARMRDVIVLASKMLAGQRIIQMSEQNQSQQQPQQQKQLLPQQQSDQNLKQGQCFSPTKKNPQQMSPTRKKQKASTKDLVQLAQLTKQCKQLSILSESLKKQLQESKLKQLQTSVKFKESQQRLTNISKNYFIIQKQLNDIKNKNSSDDDKFVFVNNQIRVLKEENEELKKSLLAVNQNLMSTKLQLKSYCSEEEKDKPTYDVLFQMYNRYKNQSDILNKRITYAESQSSKHEESIQMQRQKNQELNYEFQRLNNKYQSLLRESKVSSLEQKNIKTAERGRQDEIIRLKLQIKNLVDQNDDLRKRIVVKQPQKLQSKNPKKAQLKQLQKLANVLSETITEKDLIIADMRQVNKQMAIKVKNLQDRIRTNEEKEREKEREGGYKK